LRCQKKKDGDNKNNPIARGGLRLSPPRRGGGAEPILLCKREKVSTRCSKGVRAQFLHARGKAIISLEKEWQDDGPAKKGQRGRGAKQTGSLTRRKKNLTERFQLERKSAVGEFAANLKRLQGGCC